MKIVQITPGAGKMFCGGCFRDNTLVHALRDLGHSALMVPLYLPLTLDEADESRGVPIFFGGINVYLEQKLPVFRHAPRWLHRLLDAPAVLDWAAGAAVKTRPEEAGDLALSMVQGEHGRQARELAELLDWLDRETSEKPEIVCLSNALLSGLARRLKARLGVPVACTLQGEDWFLDALPEKQRDMTWQTLIARAKDVDLFIAPSRYFAELMARRLELRADQIAVVPNGIALAGYEAADAPPAPPVLGYFARMCQVKGLDTLLEAYLLLKRRERWRDLRLCVGGGLGPSDEPFVAALRERLKAAGCLHDAEFCPNLDKAAKQRFLRTLSVLSTPAIYGEAFGLYVIEAMAAGVPVVQPRHGAFPEIVEATGGGILCDPGNPLALAEAIESLLSDEPKRRALAEAGRRAVIAGYSARHMAERMLACFGSVLARAATSHSPR
jgi:glycosyltransferase involved in cell wall biosynthesis